MPTDQKTFYDRKQLYQRANELFEASNDSQKELADALGKSQSEVSRALRGLNVETARKIVEHYTGLRVSRGFVARDEA